jgi:hypothetical protein
MDGGSLFAPSPFFLLIPLPQSFVASTAVTPAHRMKLFISLFCFATGKSTEVLCLTGMPNALFPCRCAVLGASATTVGSPCCPLGTEIPINLAREIHIDAQSGGRCPRVHAKNSTTTHHAWPRSPFKEHN